MLTAEPHYRQRSESVRLLDDLLDLALNARQNRLAAAAPVDVEQRDERVWAPARSRAPGARALSKMWDRFLLTRARAPIGRPTTAPEEKCNLAERG